MQLCTRELIDAIEEHYIVWANKDKKPGWCKRVEDSDKRIKKAINRVKKEAL